MAKSNAPLTGDQIASLIPFGSATFFVEIDHEIFSMVILSHLLIQKGQLSVSGRRMHKCWLTA